MELIAPHHDPERVELPQGVLGPSRASAAFLAGAATAVAVLAVPLWAAVAWTSWHG
jgi:hypothetical protein